jgi:methylated-DNA-[protein]-cysteine S-methyltransferase
MTDTVFTIVPSPVGDLVLTGDGTTISRIGFAARTTLDPAWREDPAPFTAAVEQLGQYFAGERRSFDLPLTPEGTDFQRRVWAALAAIPYGETTSYAALADAIGHPGSARAVGAANGANPLAIVVPCHRVVGADGMLTGYAGGLDAKRSLLTLEADPPAA